MTRTKRCLQTVMVAATLCVQLPVRANVFDGEPSWLKARPQSPIGLQQKRPSALEEYIKPAATNAAYVTPVPLHGIRIPGLTSKTVDTLGFNNFVVINNLKNARMADVYKDNRLNGKANFVTTDCVLHPYVAFTNRVLADAAESFMAADLRLLLQAMLEQSAIDYNGSDDAEVRDDIERNIAYLAVGIKLIDPKYTVLNMGRVQTLVDHDLRNIMDGNRGFSDIFDREEDFKIFRPVGWYNSSPKLANFYRAREWISRMSFPISDVTVGNTGGKSNSFRRSVLLFRALELARIDGKPALTFYDRVLKEISLLGPQPNSWRDRVLYPGDYKSTFKNDANNLRDTLNGLSQPFYRTKLLLAVRRQKPMNLGSASIFEIEDSAAQKGSTAAFRLLPVIGDPEIAWMQNTAQAYPVDQEGGTWWPAALADLSAWGSGHAGNLILQNTMSLDPGFNKAYPDLHRAVISRSAAGQPEPISSRQWQLFSNYFKAFPDSTHPALRGEMWLTHRLESAIAAWLDSVNNIAPKPAPGAAVATASPGAPTTTTPKAASPSSAAPAAATAKSTTGTAPAKAANAVSPRVDAPGSADEAPADEAESGKLTVRDAKFTGELTSRKSAAGAAVPKAPVITNAAQANALATTTPLPPPGSAAAKRKAAANYHVLEPDAPMFAQIQADAKTLQQTMSELGILQPYQKNRFDDFIRLAARLQSIAEIQISGRPLSPADHGLLGNIDTVLDKVDVPLPTVMGFPGGHTDPKFKQHPGSGFNIGLGRPGLLHVLVQNPRTQDWTLARGAVYSYYEFAGEPVTPTQWQSALDYNTARPPTWLRLFDIVQPRQVAQEENAPGKQPSQTANTVDPN